MSLDIGDIHTAQATFKNAAGALTNPSAVTLRVIAPDGVVTTPSATNSSVGVWEYALSLTQAGVYSVKFTGTGTVAAAITQQVYVQRDRT